MRKSQPRLFGSVVLVLSSIVLPLAGQEISEPAKQQIAEVLQLKKSLTASQQKLSSRLLLATMRAKQLSTGTVADTVQPGTDVDSSGNIVVEIKTNSLGDAMTRVNAVGGVILSASSDASVVKAQVPVLTLESIADSSAVASINPPSLARTNKVRAPEEPFISPTTSFHAGLSARQALKNDIQSALPLLASNGFYPSLRGLPLRLNPFVGSITSQGYVTHQANQAVALGFDGTGVRIGVLSDSASPTRVSALIASGDLPPDTVIVPGQAGSGEDEGTAMMEIVHDIAPGAKLFFATAFTSAESFAENIRTLQSVYGCDIIVDDVSYFEEPAFQDGLIAQAVNDVTAAGVLYFSSAANSGNLTFGTSGTWEGDFRSAGDAGFVIDTSEGRTLPANNFALSGPPVGFDTLTASTIFIGVHWSDPLGASANDYDIFLLNAAGTAVIDFSIGTQNGTQDPIEAIYSSSGYPVNSKLVIVKFNGEDRAIHVDTERGRLAIATSGATFGHNAGLNTVSMAATAWNSARRGTIPFSAASSVEPFSSDGPRKVFFYPDGTPITMGNYLFGTNGGTTLQKPDLTAADGVFTKTPLFLPFYGTSAAAPHAAAIAALVKSANPTLTNAQIKQIMIDTAVDNMTAGVDRDSGFGITMALPAIVAASNR